MIILSEIVDIVIGVDTHKNTHTAAVVSVDPAPPLEQLTTSADPAGYRTLLAMAERHSLHRVWAIEGTSSYGAGLARFLTRAGETVFEVDRPARAPRRNGVKTDAVDAVRAARELLTRDRQAVPRSYEQRAALSHLLTARRSAVSAAGDAQRQLQSLVVTAPDKLRDPLRELKTPKMVQVCARLRVHPTWDLTTATTAKVLRDLARRVQHLTAEAARYHSDIQHIVSDWRPDLLQQLGVGPIVAATVLCAWSHPGRFPNHGSFAMLAGTAPIDVATGNSAYQRLNRFGDRKLNSAIHTVVLTRLRLDPQTRAYAERRRAQGMTDRAIKRCLKRYVTRQLYRLLENPQPTLDAT